MSNTIQLANLTRYSSVDGPGLRTVVWFQGCIHNCLGCHNPQTHDVSGGDQISVQTLFEQIRTHDTQKITLSGGDPFLQSEALHELCTLLRDENYDIWVYTGYTLEELLKNPFHRLTLSMIDVLVDGPFIQSLRDVNLSFKGSSNQRVIELKQYFNSLSL